MLKRLKMGYLVLGMITFFGMITPTIQAAEGAKKKLVLIAGRKSHAYGQHAFKAGCLLLKDCLDKATPNIETVVVLDGWPKDSKVFDGASAIVIYSDGGGGHPFLPHLKEIDALAKKGVGIGMMHYGVEVTKGPGGDAFLDWIGGFFEANWSVNPTWTLVRSELAKNHPVTNGVGEVRTLDEWYYHMRFRDKMDGVTSILSSFPPKETLNRPDGPHSGNPFVRESMAKGESQVLAWVRERPDGGRGFGYTGGHFHWNWGVDSNRKMVLNALVWLCKEPIPEGGIASARPPLEELKKNQDYDLPKNFDFESIEKRLTAGNK
ncbi:MAG: ThuA domain-containing protein [Gemmataceae bacterium]|nr:MAG: hypothetical protein DWI28_05800 [Planctomycetota bacterium]